MFSEVSSEDGGTAVRINEDSLVNTHGRTHTYRVCARLNVTPLCLWCLMRCRLAKVSREMKQQGHSSEMGKENTGTNMCVCVCVCERQSEKDRGRESVKK